MYPPTSGFSRGRRLVRTSSPLVIVLLSPFFAAPAFSQGAVSTTAPATGRQARPRKVIYSPYRKWLNEDVVYIISDDEKRAFKILQTDRERDQFIEQFWFRRDPTPDTIENEYRAEYYRRIAYANEQFACGIPGWKTDRGLIYIKYGAPDEIQQGSSPGDPQNAQIPYEKWIYRSLYGYPSNLEIEFSDPTQNGMFHMNVERFCELTRQCTEGPFPQVLSLGDDRRPSSGPLLANRLEKIRTFQPQPMPKFKDLEASVDVSAKFNLLPMKVRTDFIPVTGSSVLSNITIQFNRKDLHFKPKNEISTATVNLYARITSMTSRRAASWFEDVVTVDVPGVKIQQAMAGLTTYQSSVPLMPGRYLLNIAAKDLVSGNLTNFETELDVPQPDSDRLQGSSLILADQLEKVPTDRIGRVSFPIGGSKVRPRMDDTFKREETLGMYLQVYNFEIDAKTGKPDGTVGYEITRSGSGEKVFELSEQVSAISGGASQVVIEKLLPLRNLGIGPGQYTLKIKVVDKRRNQTLTPSATFTVT